MIWQLWNIPSIPLVNHVPIFVLLYIDFFRSNVRSPGVLLNIIDPHLIAGYSLVSGTFFSPKKTTQKNHMCSHSNAAVKTLSRPLSIRFSSESRPGTGECSRWPFCKGAPAGWLIDCLLCFFFAKFGVSLGSLGYRHRISLLIYYDFLCILYIVCNKMYNDM